MPVQKDIKGAFSTLNEGWEYVKQRIRDEDGELPSPEALNYLREIFCAGAAVTVKLIFDADLSGVPNAVPDRLGSLDRELDLEGERIKAERLQGHRPEIKH